MCIPTLYNCPYTVTICCYGHRMGQIFQWGTTYLTQGPLPPLTPDKRNLFLVNKYSVYPVKVIRWGSWSCTLIKKKTKFSSYLRKSRRDRLQSHKWLTASSYMTKYLRISSYTRKAFLIYDFATAPIWISLYMRKIWFSFLPVYLHFISILKKLS